MLARDTLKSAAVVQVAQPATGHRVDQAAAVEAAGQQLETEAMAVLHQLEIFCGQRIHKIQLAIQRFRLPTTPHLRVPDKAAKMHTQHRG